MGIFYNLDNPSTRSNPSRNKRGNSRYGLTNIDANFNASIREIQNLTIVADILEKNNKLEACKEIHRYQIVALESALDTYVSAIISYGLLRIFNGDWRDSRLPIYYKVPLSSLSSKVESDSIPCRAMRKIIAEEIKFNTYMKSEKIKSALNDIGIRSRELNIDDQLFEECDRIAKRRDNIVHSSDRPNIDCQDKQSIDKEIVNSSINNIKVLQSRIHNAVRIKDSDNDIYT